MIAFGDFLISGTAVRYFRAAWPYGVFFLAPFLNVLLFAVLAIGAGVVAARSDNAIISSPWPRPSGLVALRHFRNSHALARDAAGGCDRPWRTGFLRAHSCIGRRPAMDARLEQFAQRLVAAARDGGCEEIIVVGHSLGATMALVVLTRALEIDGDLARQGAKICLLTVGSTIPKLALASRRVTFARLRGAGFRRAIVGVDRISGTARRHQLFPL